MGNRGLLHNERQEIIRPWQLKRWIICVLDFKGRQRNVMTKGRYTELFFTDEATALSAGHRPCAECQRDKLTLFKKYWTAANGISIKSLTEMDDYLHEERINPVKQEIILRELPDGVFIEYEGGPYLVLNKSIHRWTFEGYKQQIEMMPSEVVKVLTPMSIVRSIREGYLPSN
jgi:glutaredoxin